VNEDQSQFPRHFKRLVRFLRRRSRRPARIAYPAATFAKNAPDDLSYDSCRSDGRGARA